MGKQLSLILLLVVLTSCTNQAVLIDEEMRLFTSALNTPSTPTVVLPTSINVIISGQSIAQGQLSAASSGYSSAKLNNINANYLECKTATHTWEQFTSKMMSPYQYIDPAPWGCGMEYSFAEYYTDLGIEFNLYKPAYGGQKFGSPTSGGTGAFYVNPSSTPIGSIAVDMFNVLTAQKSLGVTFDYMVWQHGESDTRDNADSRAEYAQHLIYFITMIRGIYPNLPFYIRKLPDETSDWLDGGAAGAGGLVAINTNLQYVVDNVANCYLITMPEPFSQYDLIHPNHEGNDQMALAYWSILDPRL